MQKKDIQPESAYYVMVTKINQKAEHCSLSTVNTLVTFLHSKIALKATENVIYSILFLMRPGFFLVNQFCRYQFLFLEGGCVCKSSFKVRHASSMGTFKNISILCSVFFSCHLELKKSGPYRPHHEFVVIVILIPWNKIGFGWQLTI